MAVTSAERAQGDERRKVLVVEDDGEAGGPLGGPLDEGGRGVRHVAEAAADERRLTPELEAGIDVGEAPGTAEPGSPAELRGEALLRENRLVERSERSRRRSMRERGQDEKHGPEAE